MRGRGDPGRLVMCGGGVEKGEGEGEEGLMSRVSEADRSSGFGVLVLALSRDAAAMA